MSKPNSGYFIGTAGSNNTFKNLSQKEYKSVIILPKGIDTREHATKYKQLSSNRRKILHKKEDNRTITKEEYRRLNWQRRLDKRRRDGIEAFWEAEADRINRKLPTTRNWTVTQREAILNGLRPKFKGEPMQSHHTYNVAKYPHLANIGFLIYPVTRNEHFNRWHNRSYTKSLPGKPMNYQIKEDF
ncbi:MAG: hypothetical protein II483_07950 [Lachnospiraceae bacterium]|nr:hypothetical protein [Lachnospiraceae bacterium]MBQ2559404.1 hypothetical protein [Fibrobacter sp.]